MKIIPDTSVIVDGRVTNRIKEREQEDIEVIVPEAVISELERQANQGEETGMSGLEEVQELNALAQGGIIELHFRGERPDPATIENAGEGAMDSLIRETAAAEGGTLLTSDIVQAEVARARGIDVEYLEPEVEHQERTRIAGYFKEDVMSVHLKDGVKPKVQIGRPGDIHVETLDEEPQTEKELRQIAHEVMETAERSSEGFIEMDKEGATVVQLGDMRIVISHPPFSERFEITAVRPVADVSLDDYRLSEKLKARLAEKQRGVLLAGSPGAGKSTLAQAVAEYMLEKGYMVKTLEEPRDLQVSGEITQYTSLEDDIAESADVLLLVRPDYTIYDEVRKTPHFKVFADMRLAGVGMVGVTHANRAIDALQRLIGRVELGMAPQVVDTIVYVEEAKIAKIYDITYTVKVPSGMMEEDLARPVIEVRDFETDELEYEVYSYGEQVVVMPVEETGEKKGTQRLAEDRIEDTMRRYVHDDMDVEVKGSDTAVVRVPEKNIPNILGEGGSRINGIEKELGIHIDVRPLEKGGKRIKNKEAEVWVERDQVVLKVGKGLAGEKIDVTADGTHLLTATVGGDGSIKIRKGTEPARRLQDELDRGSRIEIS